MRALALHPDVLVVTSALLHVNCVIVRGAAGDEGDMSGEAPAPGTAPASSTQQAGETFVIDSPVLPDELDALAAIVEQARFSSPSGLLVTHGDWDHLLGPLAFPGVPIGCAASTAGLLKANPGAAQRELRSFDEALMIQRTHPLALGALQVLPVPGHCAIGRDELQLQPAEGHSADGMAIWIPWAKVLAAGDYLSTVEIPTFGNGGTASAYLATLERLRGWIQEAVYVVPGHGPILDREVALATLESDLAYVRALAQGSEEMQLPDGRRGRAQRALHARNMAKHAP